MINELISGIYLKLNNHFNPDWRDGKFTHTVYSAPTMGKLELPHFIVTPIQNIHNVTGTKTVKNTIQIAVHYCSKDYTYAHYMSVYEVLCDILATINQAHCFQFDYNVSDSVLTVICTYKIHSYEEVEKAELMNDLTTETRGVN